MRSFPALFQRKSGTLQLEGDTLEFVPDPGIDTPRVRLLCSELELAWVGENSQVVLLTRAGDPNLEISVTDPALLQELSRQGVNAASEMIQKGKIRKSRRHLLLGSFAAAILFLLVGMPLLVSRLPGAWIERMVSVDTEKRLGEVLADARDLDQKGKSPAGEKLVKMVTFLQAKNPGLTRLKLDVRFSPSAEVNAFAFPGGILAVNAGLILKAESIEEVLGVLGHELGHIEERHVVKGLTGNLSYIAGAGLIGIFISPEAAGWIMRGGELALLKHSRDHEREADIRALEYLKNAGVPASGMVTFFERMQKHEPLGGVGSALSFLSTHPVSSERIEALKESMRDQPDAPAEALPVTLMELQALVMLSGS